MDDEMGPGLEDKIMAAFLGDDRVQFIDGGDASDDHIEIMLRGIEASMGPDKWDQSPVFAAVGAYRGALTCETVLLPQFVYENPVAGVEALCNALDVKQWARMYMTSQLPKNFFGLVMFSETWGVKDISDANMKEWAGHLDEHPDRIEARHGFCATLDGRIAVLMRERGSEAQFMDLLNVDGEMVAGGGRLLPLLVRFMKICKDLAPSFTETKVQPA